MSGTDTISTIGFVEFVIFLEEELRRFYTDATSIDAIDATTSIKRVQLFMLRTPRTDVCENMVFSKSHASATGVANEKFNRPQRIQFSLRTNWSQLDGADTKWLKTLDVQIDSVDYRTGTQSDAPEFQERLLHCEATVEDGVVQHSVAVSLAYVDRMVEFILAWMRKLGLAPLCGVAYTLDGETLTMKRVANHRYPIIWEFFPHTFLHTQVASSLEQRMLYPIGMPVYPLHRMTDQHISTFNTNMPSF